MSDKHQNTIENLKKLSVEERILVVEDIWDSIVSSNAEYSVPDEQKKELDLRLREHADNPGKAKSWEDVKKNAQPKL